MNDPLLVIIGNYLTVVKWLGRVAHGSAHKSIPPIKLQAPTITEYDSPKDLRYFNSYSKAKNGCIRLQLLIVLPECNFQRSNWHALIRDNVISKSFEMYSYGDRCVPSIFWIAILLSISIWCSAIVPIAIQRSQRVLGTYASDHRFKYMYISDDNSSEMCIDMDQRIIYLTQRPIKNNLSHWHYDNGCVTSHTGRIQCIDRGR